MVTRFSASLLEGEAVGNSCVDVSATVDAFNKYRHSGIRVSQRVVMEHYLVSFM